MEHENKIKLQHSNNLPFIAILRFVSTHKRLVHVPPTHISISFHFHMCYTHTPPMTYICHKNNAFFLLLFVNRKSQQKKRARTHNIKQNKKLYYFDGRQLSKTEFWSEGGIVDQIQSDSNETMFAQSVCAHLLLIVLPFAIIFRDYAFRIFGINEWDWRPSEGHSVVTPVTI